MRNLQAISTFLLLAELKHFGQVAKKTNLSTTAVSKQIKALEAELGEQLFVRTTRKVALTEFGVAFCQECEGLVDKVDQLESFIAANKGKPQGRLHIVCGLSLGHDLLMAHLPAFTARYPDIELSVEFTENTTGILQEYGDIHFAYGVHAGVTDTMRYKWLFNVCHILVAAPSYLAEHPPIVTTADLMQHTFLNLSFRDPINAFALSSGEFIELPQPKVIMNSFQSLTEACVAGMGVTLSADRFVAEAIEKGELVPVLPELDYRVLEVFVFYRAMQYELPKVRAFVDFYLEQNK